MTAASTAAPRSRSLLRAAWRGALWTVALCAVVAVLGLGVAAIRGYRPVVVLTGSMGATAPPGSLAVSGPTEHVGIGDVLVMRSAGRATITHRVVAIELAADGTAMAVTRGDANPDVDPEPYAMTGRDLTVRWVVPGAGRMLMRVRSPALGLSLAGFVVLAGMLGALRRIWRPRTALTAAPPPPPGAATTTGGRRRAPLAAATLLGAFLSGGGVAVSLYTGIEPVTANQFSTQACFGARLDDVQSGQVTTSATGTTAVAITSVDPARSFLMFSASSSSGQPDESVVLGRLATSTSLEFVRASDGAPAGDVAIEWSLVEYACGVSVQRGEVTGTGSSQIDIGISAVDPAASFVLASSGTVAGASAFGAYEQRTAVLVDADTLRLEGAGPIVSGSQHAWQVVTFDDPGEASTQDVLATLAAGADSSTLTLPRPVDPATTMVLASVRSANAGGTIGDRLVRARLVDGSTVEVQRQLTTGSVVVAVQVVELLDGSTVGAGVLDLAPGQTVRTATIPPVAASRSTAISSVFAAGATGGGSTSMATDDVVGEASARVRLVDARTVEVRRDAATDDASFAWQVITWGGPSWADLQSPFRRRVDVTAGAVVAPDGYTTSLTLDHAAMVADELSLADGSDLRLWRYDGVGWIELDRVLDDNSSWNDAATTVWFRTQEPIAAGQTVTYWLYFGNDAPATPLADPANVWLVVEGFDDGTLGAFEDRTGGTAWYRALPWTRRITLTIAAPPVALTDEQVLVRLTQPDLATHAQPDGSDIRFTAADGVTALAHEVEAFDASTGSLTAWVRIPSLGTGSPTQIMLFYGAADAPAHADPRGAWAGEQAVWQLAADPTAASPTLDDSGPAQHDGVALADASLVDSPSGPAASFDGSLDRLESAPFVLTAGTFSVAAWFRADALTGDVVVVAQGDPGTGGVFDLGVVAAPTPTGRVRLAVADTVVVATGGSVSAGAWHHLGATWDATTLRLYLDGAQVATAAGAGSVLADAPAALVIGASPTGDRALDGTIGQVRLSDSVWSAAQIGFRRSLLAGPTTVVTASAPLAGTWFDQGTWAARRPLVVESDLVAGTVTDYPLLVQLVDTDLVPDVQPDGDDLVVTAADGVTRLDHQIESWDPLTGALTVWVRVPTLVDTVDTTLFLYLSNPTAVDQQDPVGVWGADADLVVLG